MYELAEYALVIMIVAMVGGVSFVAVATFLAIQEGFNAAKRCFRTRYAPKFRDTPSQ